MKYKRALITSAKYNTLALGPTLLGVILIAIGSWFGVVEPIIEAVIDADPEELVDPNILAEIAFNPTLFGGAIIIGYFVHRVGRTALMFHLYGKALSQEYNLGSVQEQDGKANQKENNTSEGDGGVTEIIE